MMNCYDLKADAGLLKTQNFLVKYKQRIPLILNCFQNIQSDEFYRHCWFLCRKFKWNKMTDFYDGDHHMLQRIEVTMFSFLRRMSLVRDELERFNKKSKEWKNKSNLANLETINGLLYEPINPSTALTFHYALDKPTFRKIMGKISNFSLLDINMIKSLNRFLTKKKVMGRFRLIQKMLIIRQILLRVLMARRKRFREFKRHLPN